MKKDFYEGSLKVYRSVDDEKYWRISLRGCMLDAQFEYKDLLDLQFLLNEILREEKSPQEVCQPTEVSTKKEEKCCELFEKGQGLHDMSCHKEEKCCESQIEKILVGEYNRRKEIGQDKEAFGVLYAKNLLLDKLCHQPTNSQPEDKEPTWVKGQKLAQEDTKKELPCLCPKWFPDCEGGWKKNILETHVKGECPLYTEPLTEPQKREYQMPCGHVCMTGESVCGVCGGPVQYREVSEPQKPIKRPSERIREILTELHKRRGEMYESGPSWYAGSDSEAVGRYLDELQGKL